MNQPDRKTTVRIGLAQVAAGDDIAANVDRGLEWVDKAAAAGCALCVFPEMAGLGFGAYLASERDARVRRFAACGSSPIVRIT